MDIIFLLIILAVSITVHEFMHAYAGYKLGDDTALISGRLTLNPLAHIDPFATVLMPIMLYILTGIPIGAAKPVPFNPSRLKYGEYGAAIVAVSGPLTNLVVAVFFGLWIQAVTLPALAQNFFVLLVLFNLVFFVFNMIPFPPLDGSRVLYTFMPEPVRDIMRKIESFGLVGIVIFIFLLYPLIAPAMSSIIGTLMGWLLPSISLF